MFWHFNYNLHSHTVTEYFRNIGCVWSKTDVSNQGLGRHPTAHMINLKGFKMIDGTENKTKQNKVLPDKFAWALGHWTIKEI